MRVGPAFVSYRCGCCMALIGPDKDYCDAHDTAPARIKYRILNWYYWRKRRVTQWFKRVILKDPQAISERKAQIKLSKMFVRIGTASVPRGQVLNDFSMMKPPDDAIYFLDRLNSNPCNEIPLEMSDEQLGREIDAQHGIHKWEETQSINRYSEEQVDKVRRLRQESTQGILQCKRALENNEWDYEKAKAWLKDNPLVPFPPLR